MAEGRVHLLHEAIRGDYWTKPRWPVAQLKATFSKEDVMAWIAAQQCTTGGYLCVCRALLPWNREIMMTETYREHGEWCVAYLQWMIEDMGIPFNDPVARDNQDTMLDYVFKHVPLSSPARNLCLLFLFKHRAKSNGLLEQHFFLECHNWSTGKDRQILYALLDRGCHTPKCNSDYVEYYENDGNDLSAIAAWEASRCQTRLHCWLVLGLGRRRTQWSACVPYDVWKMIARHMWSMRWDQ